MFNQSDECFCEACFYGDFITFALYYSHITRQSTLTAFVIYLRETR